MAPLFSITNGHRLVSVLLCFLKSFLFIEQEIIQLNSTLVCPLSKRLNVLEKNKHYFHVVDPLKQGKWLMALWEMIVHPYLFVHFVQQIPRIAGRWINYYITKIKPMNNHEFIKIEENYKA